MYRVVDWNTDKIYDEFEKLTDAKRYCRNMGHTGEDIEIFTGYPPVAYVTNEKDECVYNPRFKKIKQ